MYKHKVYLTNGGVVKLFTPELPMLSEENLLHFKDGDEITTFVLENISYINTKPAE